MDNQLDKAGARKRAAWLPNNTMAAIVAAIGACQIGLANDRNAIVAADNEGNPFKALCGTATDDSNFTFTTLVMQLPLPFTLAFGNQATSGAKRIRVTSGGVYFETYNGVAWFEMGVFF